MKRLFLYAAILFAVSCADDSQKIDKESTEEAPAALEGSTKHPSGVNSGSVISTDTSAMKLSDTSVRKTDTVKP